jgi:uncharacterized protein YndB with AHSA1/START domain
MSTVTNGTSRAVADLPEGCVTATVEVEVPPERAFRALTSKEIVAWWFRPDVFNTTDWTGEVRPSGSWRSEGGGRRGPYALEGEFLEVQPPRRLVHTWRAVGPATGTTTVTYLLEPTAVGTRITLRHTGFASRDRCAATATGWETSLQRLAEHLAPERPTGP